MKKPVKDAIEGGCLCGAIRYLARGKPLLSTICHCRTCRKSAGSPAVAWITVKAEDFSLVRGTPIRYRSTPPVWRTFCGACGTPLTYVHEQRASEVDITTCSVDDPEAFPPSFHVFMSDHLSWARFGDGLPAYDTTPDAASQVKER